MARSAAAGVLRAPRPRRARRAARDLDLVPDLVLELFSAREVSGPPEPVVPRRGAAPRLGTDEEGRASPTAPAL